MPDRIPAAAHLPTLKVVALDRMRPHEQVDPLRVARLAGRFADEGIQLNPVICIEKPNGDLVLLDGATRTAAMQRLGLTHGVAQIVEPDSVVLETWHHVITGPEPGQFVMSVVDRDGLEISPDGMPPRVWTPDGVSRSIASPGLSQSRALSMMVSAYIGAWKVNRVAEVNLDEVSWRFPGWAAIVEFPTLTIENVEEASLARDLLPAGITRFIVPDRALRLNLALAVLKSSASTEEKQRELDIVVAERAGQGRIRRYEESVVILDD